MTFDPEQEEAEREAQVSRDAEKKRLLAIQYNNYLADVLATYQGRAVFWRIFGEAGMYQTTYRGENTHASAYAEGRRSLGLQVLDDCLTADENAYNLMRVEAAERSAVYENSRGDVTNG